MKFGLENISRLCAALDHPERAFQSIIVAGTNGKGSVTAMVHRGLVAAGHASARYTSPHLERIEERYVIGSREASRDELEAAADVVRTAVERLQRSGALEAPPTFFECATALGFVLFRDAGVRVAVLEVGLGGRLDATNIVTPLVAAVTSIDFDHQAQLGNTLESIAFEKGGVIKPGVPLVCGRVPLAAEKVLRALCTERSSRFVPAETSVELDGLIGDGQLSLPGAHQRGNAEVAACLLQEIDAGGIAVGRGAMRAALTDVTWPGRLERLRCGTAEVLLDAAHNPAGTRALAAYVREIGWTGCTVVFGAMRDKDVGGMLAELSPVCRTLVCTTAETPRAAQADELATIARRIPDATWTIAVEPCPPDAVALAASLSPQVVVAGSIFLIGPLRGILRPR